MAKRYEGVRKIKDNTYEINFRPIAKGRRVFARIKANSPQEAYMQRAQAIADYLKKNDIPQTERKMQEADIHTLKLVLENDLRSDNKGRKTINRFLLTYRKFTEFLRKRYPDIQNINQVRSHVISHYKDYIVLDLKRPRGWRAELTIIKSIFSRLRKKGYCNKEVLEELKPFKRPPRIEKHYKDIPKSDVKKLLAYIKNDRNDVYGIVYTIYRLGWRIAETTFLRKEDVKLNGLKPIEIKVRGETTKTGRTRILDIFDDELAQVIKQYLFGRNSSEWLFPNTVGNRFSPDRARDYLKQASKEILGYAITPHDFRHRFCTVMGRNNVPIKDVMAISGIQDTDVLLNYYTHSTIEGKKKVLEVSRDE